jgi:hypothetical protein
MIGVDHAFYVDGARVTAQKMLGAGRGAPPTTTCHNRTRHNNSRPVIMYRYEQALLEPASTQEQSIHQSINRSIHDTASVGQSRTVRRHHHWRDLKKLRLRSTSDAITKRTATRRARPSVRSMAMMMNPPSSCRSAGAVILTIDRRGCVGLLSRTLLFPLALCFFLCVYQIEDVHYG